MLSSSISNSASSISVDSQNKAPTTGKFRINTPALRLELLKLCHDSFPFEAEHGGIIPMWKEIAYRLDPNCSWPTARDNCVRLLEKEERLQKLNPSYVPPPPASETDPMEAQLRSISARLLERYQKARRAKRKNVSFIEKSAVAPYSQTNSTNVADDDSGSNSSASRSKTSPKMSIVNDLKMLINSPSTEDTPGTYYEHVPKQKPYRSDSNSSSTSKIAVATGGGQPPSLESLLSTIQAYHEETISLIRDMERKREESLRKHFHQLVKYIRKEKLIPQVAADQEEVETSDSSQQ